MASELGSIAPVQAQQTCDSCWSFLSPSQTQPRTLGYKAPRYLGWFVPSRAFQRKGVSCCQPAVLSSPNDPTDRSMPGTWLSPRPCGVHRCWFSHSRPGNVSGSKATRGQVIDLLMEPRQEACAVAFWLRARPPAEHSLLWLAILHAQ